MVKLACYDLTCGPPTVDGLIGVAYDSDVALLRKQLHEFVLCCVGILHTNGVNATSASYWKVLGSEN